MSRPVARSETGLLQKKIHALSAAPMQAGDKDFQVTKAPIKIGAFLAQLS